MWRGNYLGFFTGENLNVIWVKISGFPGSRIFRGDKFGPFSAMVSTFYPLAKVNHSNI